MLIFFTGLRSVRLGRSACVVDKRSEFCFLSLEKLREMARTSSQSDWTNRPDHYQALIEEIFNRMAQLSPPEAS